MVIASNNKGWGEYNFLLLRLTFVVIGNGKKKILELSCKISNHWGVMFANLIEKLFLSFFMYK